MTTVEARFRKAATRLHEQTLEAATRLHIQTLEVATFRTIVDMQSRRIALLVEVHNSSGCQTSHLLTRRKIA
jgi:hypothetical protein